jgi:hypothetical protein
LKFGGKLATTIKQLEHNSAASAIIENSLHLNPNCINNFVVETTEKKKN